VLELRQMCCQCNVSTLALICQCLAFLVPHFSVSAGRFECAKCMGLNGADVQ
jgi:hypothetical protein